jgi:hypothetical protein
MDDHLEMHFRQNCKANQNIGRGHSRSWFIGIEARIKINVIISLIQTSILGLDTRHFG